MRRKLINKNFILIIALLVIGVFVFFKSSVFASTTDGMIDSSYKYAWGENVGWLNFGTTNGNVHVTDSGLSGYALGENIGWINLDNIINDGEGNLSGLAWGENIGWVKFNPTNGGVIINSSGEFTGSALSENVGWIIFGGDYKVKTDWRPRNARPACNNEIDDDSDGKIDYPNDPGCDSLTDNNETDPSRSSSGGYILPRPSILPPVLPSIITPIVSVVDDISKVFNSVSEDVLNFFRPKNKTNNEDIVQVPKIAPLSFNTQWNLLPVKAISQFVFAPLPYEVRTLVSKFPELNKTFKDVGVNRMTDMNKLTGVTLNTPALAELDKTMKTVGVENLPNIGNINGVSLNIPGITNINQEMIGSVGTGKIALIQGLPLAKFSLAAKKNLPTEFVFARAGGELVDLNVALSIGDKGEVTQKIASLPGKMLRLVVKPISKARSVSGYFVFKSATPKVAENEIPRASLMASALFSMNSLVEQNPQPVAVENKLVLSSFEYTDPDHDGIYTADVASPIVPGEYEIITVIDYIDPVLGVRQMRMINVVDPEGYVYEKNNDKETRIPSAIVSLYYLNPSTKKYELWSAKEYQQENPQVTDVRGTYSFLVPEGSYYFTVEAPGYDEYNGKVFVVTEGEGIHQNIELSSGRGWLSNFDWKTVLLVAVFLLLIYNLYRNALRNKLSKILKKYE